MLFQGSSAMFEEEGRNDDGLHNPGYFFFQGISIVLMKKKTDVCVHNWVTFIPAWE
jgi:hypothetical protein